MVESTAESLSEVFARFEGKEEELIPVLQAVQGELGYLPPESMQEIARFLSLPESRVYGVASFSAQFRFSPIGKNHILVCRGTACHVRGGRAVLEELQRRLGIKEGETTGDMLFSLETVACIGACGLSPAIMINKRVEGRLTPKRIAKIIDRIRDDAKEV